MNTKIYNFREAMELVENQAVIMRSFVFDIKDIFSKSEKLEEDVHDLELQIVEYSTELNDLSEKLVSKESELQELKSENEFLKKQLYKLQYNYIAS